MKFALFSVLLASVILAACGGGDGGSGSGNSNVLANETRQLAEGQYVSYSLEPGSYTMEATASVNGITVSWVGGTACSNSGNDVKTYKGSCTLSQKGQVTIMNPTALGLGADEVVTVKITRN